MPNWCYTDLQLNGSEKAISELTALIEEFMQKDEVFCNALIPRPEAEKENWYDWNWKNWGSKWDVRELNIEYEDPTQLDISFCSAWSPITPIFDELVNRGFKVYAEFKDEGYIFAGNYTDGETTMYDIEDCQACLEKDEADWDCECEGSGVIIKE